MTEVEIEFRTAIETARHALAQFNAEPMVASKRGGPRISPWWRVWVQASEVGQRWGRQLDSKPPPSREYEVDPSLDATIDRLLADDAGEGGGKGRWSD